MKRKKELQKKIQKIRERLNYELLQDINNNMRNNLGTLQVSLELDKLIVEYMRMQINFNLAD